MKLDKSNFYSIFQFHFKGKTYECIGEDKEFQIKQFNYCIEIQDWVTLKNRITNQLKWGPNIKEIKE